MVPLRRRPALIIPTFYRLNGSGVNGSDNALGDIVIVLLQHWLQEFHKVLTHSPRNHISKVVFPFKLIKYHCAYISLKYQSSCYLQAIVPEYSIADLIGFRVAFCSVDDKAVVLD